MSDTFTSGERSQGLNDTGVVIRYALARQFIGRDWTVADVACSSGYGTSLLARSAKSAIGIDYSQEVIDYANAHYAAKTITFIRHDAESLSLVLNNLDMVVSFETIEHVPRPAKFLSECHKSLKPGGLLMLSTPNKTYSEGTNKFHISEMTPQQLLGLLGAAGFTTIQTWGRNKAGEGGAHQFAIFSGDSAACSP